MTPVECYQLALAIARANDHPEPHTWALSVGNKHNWELLSNPNRVGYPEFDPTPPDPVSPVPPETDPV